jgi:hypothetical protein
MSKLFEMFKSLISTDDQAQRREEEAYLAQAVDNYDLERRMRVIDRGQRYL